MENVKDGIDFFEPEYSRLLSIFLGIIGFLMWTFPLIVAFPKVTQSSINIILVLFVGIIIGSIFYIITMYDTKRITIELTYNNKEEFLKKINTLLSEIGYAQDKDLSTDTFLLFKPSFRSGIVSGKIGLTFNKNKAKLYGVRYYIRKFKNLTF